MSDFDPVRVSASLSDFGPFQHHVEIASTQDVCASQPVGSVVVADVQTAGRGRLDRSWESEPGDALLCSVSLPASHEPQLRSMQVALAVCRALNDLGVDATIKWPNDVLIGERKVAGILAELVGDKVVVGFGVNVKAAPDVDRPATSIADHSVAVRRDDLLISVLARLKAITADESWFDGYRAMCSTISTAVTVIGPEGELSGTAQDILPDGSLLVDGNRVLVGDVIHVR